ncbi:hypothetical protein CAI21_03285 [Alkalilimnicola ehrlichii]|uniref:Uncharacterized protein n=1 Tax=Alkalilimnicola ehrlichii TaxID=351052 RepID=A0A3E0X0M4_9GAMM|nr:efflux RND transporter periplasmic adaptor subunit [Alkalilimnicola ehrlichii]RFA31009.1 hypothetical protein CAI21_03285 [Alkalilimnicola ehrlichii]RFA38962.1 hypothetical protein CAL65_03435 [Alkalilimnicola ehrlichii]
MKQTKSRRWAWFLGLVIFLALAVSAWTRWAGGEAAVDYRTVEVVMGNVERTVTAVGALQPKDYVDVGTQVSGQLLRVHVEVGDRVEQGQLLAEIDPTVYAIRVRAGEANLERLRAQLAQQEAELRLARQRLARNRQLLEQRATSRETVEENEASVHVGEARIAAIRAEIAAAEANLEGDRANLAYTRITAPIGGTVVDESAVAGQTVNASQSAPEIVRLANLDTMTVWAQVAEADVTRLRRDMPAYFTTLGMPERRWRSSVRQVLPTPKVENGVVLYNVLIDVDNEDQLLMTDMTVQVFFLLDEATDVPLVPVAALTPARGPGGRYEVRVMTPNGIETRQIEVGVRSRTSAEVRSGLEVGDKVVLGAPAAATRSAAGGAAMRGRW